jgi:hypothetical protein
VKDLFLVLRKKILHSVQDDKINGNRLLQNAPFHTVFMINEIRLKEQGLIIPEKAGYDQTQLPNRRKFYLS